MGTTKDRKRARDQRREKAPALPKEPKMTDAPLDAWHRDAPGGSSQAKSNYGTYGRGAMRNANYDQEKIRTMSDNYGSGMAKSTKKTDASAKAAPKATGFLTMKTVDSKAKKGK